MYLINIILNNYLTWVEKDNISNVEAWNIVNNRNHLELPIKAGAEVNQEMATFSTMNEEMLIKDFSRKCEYLCKIVNYQFRAFFIFSLCQYKHFLWDQHERDQSICLQNLFLGKFSYFPYVIHFHFMDTLILCALFTMDFYIPKAWAKQLLKGLSEKIIIAELEGRTLFGYKITQNLESDNRNK